ncbi:MAG: hypothetical protein ACI9X0_002710 [Kiritimatiellia bacterium]|jgi:hypothetical protein
MKAGYWLRGTKHVQIRDHEQDMRGDASIAKHLGISAKVVRQFSELHSDREGFLMAIMAATDVVRVRGHQEYSTFEYHAEDDTKALRSIRRFADDCLCDTSMLKIVNLRDMQERWVRAAEL